MPGLQGGAREYKSDQESIDSQGSVTVSQVSGNYGGPYDNEAYIQSVAASRATLATTQTDDSRKQLYGVDENEERGNWDGRFDFLLSLLGYAVGLGNVWRFPYLCYRNGGGAFLIPFAIMMCIVGVPLFYMEASIGQFTSRGPMTCWGFAPVFKGVGISMVLVSAMTSMYYNMILAWSIYYMFASFTSNLPWTDCYNRWNSQHCSQKLPLTTCDDGIKYGNGTCFEDDEMAGVWNDTLFEEKTGIKRVSPAEEYFNKVSLQLSSGIDEFGQPHWYLVLCLMLAWIIVFFCLIKGIKSTGKVVYFTAVFPYVVLLILFFRGVTLDNAGEGIKYFIVPVWDRLLDARVWKDAAVQIFFSMSIAGGGLVTLSSYNRFHNNILKDTVIVCLGDFFTCIFAGFVIFSYLGFMAGKQGTTVDKVAQDGAGLAFVVYPEAVTNLPAPPFWSILFFFMLITLGLDSQFAMVETVLTGCMDQVPVLRQFKTFVILVICAIFFLLGLPLTCSGGMYLLQILDNFVGGWTLLIIGFAENMAIAYCYGVPRFCKDLEVMLGFPQNIYFKICWYAVSPLAVLFIFVFTFVDYEASTYGDYTFPAWADGIGWVLACLVISPIIIVMFYTLAKEDDTDSPLEKLRLLITPTREWGPYLVKHRRLIEHVEGFVVDPYEEKQTTRGYSKYSDINRSQSISTIASKSSMPSFNRSFGNLSATYSANISLGSQKSKQSRMTVESTV
ncbi:sodium- and chloride-dependent glycine transporter 1-like [Mercenaria mercenaria]|uniref:sodium- and chloride-dependent glycine transporter 1-like n=1 Tax=Mercenaria mercenaria TaxID=6596 RepID=UPI001E1D5ABA|nr:sodium- and chloride-dependent glycine transporter 1-like [Mercenaria mercenaria]